MSKTSQSGAYTVNGKELNLHFQSLHHEYGISGIPLAKLSKQPPLIFSPDCCIRETLISLNHAGVDAGIVIKNSRLPLGIASLKNLLDAITLHGADLEDPVIRFMTAAPLCLPEDAPVHRAKILMTRNRISHLVLTDSKGNFSNLISHIDIPGFREGGADDLAEKINSADSITALANLSESVRKRGAELFVGGMGVEALCQWMSGLNDLIVMQVIELTADTYDLPPVPWSWMVFGSEGRLEQTFTTDQDNGIIFEPEKKQNTTLIRNLFLPFASAVNKALDQCGFTLCKGDIMAGNPKWCLSTDEWQKTFSTWMTVPEPDSLLNSAIFFDFRPLYGQDELVDELRSWLLPKPRDHQQFIYGLCKEALSCTPPLGLFGRFILDNDKGSQSFNVKMRGARPFVDAARIWALSHKIWATNTADRIRAIAAVSSFSHHDAAAAIEAFDFIQRLRIFQQLSCENPDNANHIQPKKLNTVQRLMLKEALNQAKILQDMLKQEHRI